MSCYENNQSENTFYYQSPYNQPGPYQSLSRQPRPFPENYGGSPYNQQRQPGQPRRVPPMPKAQALDLVEKFKRWIVVATLVGFGSLGALILSNIPVSKANGATPASSQSDPNSTVPSSTSSSNANSGGIFQQQQGGYGFGSGNNYQGQGPVSRSSGS